VGARGNGSSGVLAVLVMVLGALIAEEATAKATGTRARWLVDDVADLIGVGGPDYAFLRMSDAGQPAHWDHCKPIYYAVNPLHAPPNWESIVQEAVNATVAASGFEFRNAGTTEDREFSPSARGIAAPVLIGWASASEVPILGGGIDGYGAFASYPRGDQLEATAGSVVLDAGAYSDMGHTDSKDEVFILAHELGHVLGLDHVDDIDEIMYRRYAGQDGFGPGDIEGFEVLRDQPCFDAHTE
jgi:matrixin